MLHQIIIVGVILIRQSHGIFAAPGPDSAADPISGPAPLPVISPTEPVARPFGAEDVNWFAEYLKLLLREDPWAEDQPPFLYVETSNDIDNDSGAGEATVLEKRSRYYRRYPWKRVTARSRTTYDPDMYLCNPSRDDIFQLLLALHQAREGKAPPTINFCNRQRQASAVFTNIRFIGRRK